MKAILAQQMMKKLAFLLSLLVLLSLSVSAQVGAQKSVGVINGQLFDSLSNQELSYATVALQHARFNKILNGTSTDDKGRFRLEGLAAGQYRVVISMIGYESKTITGVEIKEDKVIYDIGKIKLSSGHELATVEVSAKRAVIEQQFDKLVYNVEQDISATTLSLNDLLRKAPMVSVDPQGNVSLRGSTDFQLLIDGKPSSAIATSKADALRTIPADQVERIEVITMPSAQYDMEGAAGIINIITKHKKVKGHQASLSLSGGNYVNMFNANMSARGDLIGARLQIGGNALMPQDLHSYSYREDKLNELPTVLTQVGEDQLQRSSMNYLFGIDFDPNDFNSLSTSISYSPATISADRNALFELVTAEDLLLAKQQLLDKATDSHTLRWTLDYQRLFENPNNHWNASIQWAQYQQDNHYQLSEYAHKQQLMGEQANNVGRTTELTLQTDYVHTLSAQMKLETGAKYIQRSIDNEASVFALDIGEQLFVPMPDRSYALLYGQHIGAAYTQLNYSWNNKWNLRLGARLEYTHNDIELETQDYRDAYWNFAPTLAINYVQESSNLTLSYGRRMTRPGFNHLNPFENRQDPFNWRTGNPYLKPERIDALDLNFSQPFQKGFLNADLFYHYTHNVIERNTSLIDTEHSLSSYRNLGNTHTIGLNAYVSYNLTDELNIKAGAMSNFYQLSKSVSEQIEENGAFSQTAFSMLSWQLKNKWALESVYAFVGPKLNAQGKTPAFSTYQLTVKKELWKQLSVSLTLVNPFNAYTSFGASRENKELYEYSRMKVPLRMFMLGAKYQFTKNMPAEKADKKGIENKDVKKVEKSQY